MGTTNYATINGVLVGETGPNGTMYYHADALGSVTMTTDQNSNVLNTYRYKPYGTQLSKTGTAPDPKFAWVGAQGYRTTSRLHSEYYIRARHYQQVEGRWSTVDPLWPRQSGFVYSGGRPVSIIDPTGWYMATLSAQLISKGCHVSTIAVDTSYYILWQLTFSTSPKSKKGAIVQQIDAAWTSQTRCSTKEHLQGDFQPACWEAWDVDENGVAHPVFYFGGIFFQAPWNDNWGTVSNNECSFGNYVLSGTAKYFNGMDVTKNALGACGASPGAYQVDPPSNWDNPDSNAVLRTLFPSYNECPGCTPPFNRSLMTCDPG